METRSTKHRQTSLPKDTLPRDTLSSPPQPAQEELSGERYLHVRLLFIIIGSIFLAEVVAMIIVRRLPDLPYLAIALIDAGIMVVLVFPLLYFLSFRPLLRYIEKSQKAERAAQAERQRFNDIFEELPAYLVLLTPDYHVAFANRYFRERFGESKGRRCYEYLFERDQPCEVCETYKVLETMQPGTWEWNGPDDSIYEVYDHPFTDVDGSMMILEMGIDVTYQKYTEAENREMALFPALNPDCVLQVNESGLIKKVNPAAAGMGFSVGTHLMEVIPDLQELDLHACIAEGTTEQAYEAQLGERSLLWSVHGAPELGLAFLYSRDITERKQAEDRLRTVNRALTVLNECNQVLVRSEKEAELLQKMCQILVDVGEYRMAWVGFAEQDSAQSIRPVAQAGFDDHYLDSVQISWADNERGRGPTGTAVRLGEVQVNHNFLTNPKMAPWRESALARGYQSSIALPLQSEDSVLGALTIYSAVPEAFDQEEVHLLQELASDLAFGILALRVRAERNRAQEEIRAREQEWHTTFDAINEFVSVHDADFRILRANQAVANLFGKTPQELMGRHCYELFHGSDHPWPNCPHAKAMNLKSAVTEEVEDPTIGCPLMVSVSPIMDQNNRVVAGVHIAKDISVLKRAEEDLRKAHDELELHVRERTEELRIANSELEAEISERKQAEAALQAANEDLTRFNKIMIGRELRMIELKKEVNKLCEKAGQPLRYSLDFEKEGTNDIS